MFNISEKYDFSGKVAIVTGSSRGLGKEIACLLAQTGATVVLASRNIEKLRKVSSEIIKDGGKAIPIQTDVTDKKSVNDMVEKVYSDYGKIDILVNNAGLIRRAPATELSLEDWDATINTNLKGTFLCSQAVGRKMIEKRYGKIINLGSDKSFVGFPERAAYCASKAGVVHLTKALAVEWAPYNVQVNAIAPTYIETEMTRNVLKDPVKYKEVVRTIPMNRVGQPYELFGAILLLASDMSSFITGHTIRIDGGLTAW